MNQKSKDSKLNVFLNKKTKTDEVYKQEQKCFTRVATEACVGIQRILHFGYLRLNTILDMDMVKIISTEVLDICIKCIDANAFRYLMHLSFKLIARSLRINHDKFAKLFIELKLSNKLYSILQIIKRTLPNENGFLARARRSIQKKQLFIENDTRLMDKIKSFIELYDDIIEVLTSLTQYSQFFNLTECILDIVCIYSQKRDCKDDYMESVIAYLWNGLTRHPQVYKKAIDKNKAFMKILDELSLNKERHEHVFNASVWYLKNVLDDHNLFNITFSMTMLNDEDDEKEMIGCHCPCGKVLERKQAKHCYDTGDWLYCDLCHMSMSGDTNVYHCDKKEPEHINGYDLCVHCMQRAKFVQMSTKNYNFN